MTTQNNPTEIFDINQDRAAHLTYIASKLLEPEGKAWSYSLHHKAITLSFSHMSDLHRCEKRIKEFGLDAQTERPGVLVGKAVVREESAPPALSTGSNTITNSASTISEDTITSKCDPFDVPRLTAYHEASHAVIGYWFGWWVNHEGVRIDPDGYCGLRYQKYDYVEEHSHCIDLAGWAAEMRLLPDRDPSRRDEDLTFTLDFLHDPDEAETDDGKVLAKLKAAHPSEDRGQIIARYRAFEQVTRELVRQEHIWSAIEIIAEELLRRKHLSQSEVEDLLPEGIQWRGRLAAARIAAAS